MNRFSKSQAILVLSALLLGGIFLGGCSEEDQPFEVPTKPTVEPKTADEVVTRFVASYEKMDVSGYLDLLDPDYLTLLQADTVNEFPRLGSSLDFAEEEWIHGRLFSGEAVTDPGGEFRPAVSMIGFAHFQALDSWSPTDDPEHFPNAQWAPYEVAVAFDRGQNFSELQVDGVVKIYVRAHTKNVDGSEITFYLMAGMTDLTSNGAKGVDSTPWGSVKAYYR